jgi:hypothetical protein
MTVLGVALGAWIAPSPCIFSMAVVGNVDVAAKQHAVANCNIGNVADRHTTRKVAAIIQRNAGGAAQFSIFADCGDPAQAPNVDISSKSYFVPTFY